MALALVREPTYNSTLPQAARYSPLVVLFVAFAMGIVADRFLPFGLLAPWWFCAACLAVWVIAYRRDRHRLAAWLLLGSALFLGAAHHHQRWRLMGHEHLARAANRTAAPICFEAIAVDAPRWKPVPPADLMRSIPATDTTRMIVEVRRVRDGNMWQQASGRAELMINGRLDGVRSGDRLQIFGQFSRLSPPSNPGEFDFAAYRRGNRILCQVRSRYAQCITRLQRSGNNFIGLIQSVRQQGNRLLSKHLSHDESPLAAAVLLGETTRLGTERRDAFAHTGAAHLLAISGLHLGVLAGALLLLVRGGIVPRTAGLWTIVFLVAFYAMLTGARAPVVRAAILIGIVCIGQLQYRRQLPFNSLALAALVLLALSPADLFRTGPQLSFLAVATLVCISPILGRPKQIDPLDRLIAQTRPWPVRMSRLLLRAIWQITLVSAAVWLVTAPLVMHQFHIAAPIGVLLNALLWLPMAVALLFGFATLGGGMISSTLGDLFGAVCDAALTLLERIIAIAGSVPGSFHWVAGPAIWWIVGFYAALALWVACPRWRPARRHGVAIMAFWITCGFGAAIVRDSVVERDQLACTFLSVGDGTSVLLELPGGQTILYDAGRIGSPRIGTQSISAALWSRGIHHLDAVVISHADADHYNALPGLLERFSVGVVYVSPSMFDRGTPPLMELKSAIERAQIPIRQLVMGDSLETGSPATIEVLHPPRQGVFGSDNANSIVLAILYNDRRLLLPGDLESPGLEMVVAEKPLDCDVVMAPHHGSARSSPAGFASWCSPEWVVISSGPTRDASVAEQAYHKQGAAVKHTAHDGAVRVKVSGRSLDVDHWSSGKWRTLTRPLL